MLLPSRISMSKIASTLWGVTLLLGFGGCERSQPARMVLEEPAAEAEAPTPASDTISESEPRQSPARLTILDRSPGQAQIFIDRIVEDTRIAGRVTGVAGSAVKEFKVLVYVHTDQWYIHPWAGQGEGSSWAAVKPDLTWSIPSVKRAFAADKVAALLTRAEADAPPRVTQLEDIPAVAWVIVKGTGAV